MLPVGRQIKDCFHILLGDQKKSQSHASKFLAGKPLAMPLAMKAPGWNYKGGAVGAFRFARKEPLQQLGLWWELRQWDVKGMGK